MPKAIKGGLNTSCHSVQIILSCRLLSKTINIQIYNNILPVVLYGCKTSSVTLREKHRLKVSENMALREIRGSKGK